MRVIAVDPGYDRLGVAVLEWKNDKEHLLYSGCIETDKKAAVTERLFALGKEFQKILREYKPDTFATETLFFNTNQKTAIAVAGARGILIYLAQAAECKVYEFGPQEIKVAITGYGKSDKKAVTDMVLRLVANAPTVALDDEYDAIAVGVTCLATYGRNR